MSNNLTIKDLWNKYYGSQKVATDYAGREMRFDAISNSNNPYEPTLDHIRPVSMGGGNDLDNIIICNRLTNQEKGNNFSTWKANGKLFQAHRIRGYKNKYEICGLR